MPGCRGGAAGPVGVHGPKGVLSSLVEEVLVELYDRGVPFHRGRRVPACCLCRNGRGGAGAGAGTKIDFRGVSPQLLVELMYSNSIVTGGGGAGRVGEWLVRYFQQSHYM